MKREFDILIETWYERPLTEKERRERYRAADPELYREIGDVNEETAAADSVSGADSRFLAREGDGS